jgi:hypothetical protein
MRFALRNPCYAHARVTILVTRISISGCEHTTDAIGHRYLFDTWIVDANRQHWTTE